MAGEIAVHWSAIPWPYAPESTEVKSNWNKLMAVGIEALSSGSSQFKR